MLRDGRRLVLCACIALNCLTCGSYLIWPLYSTSLGRRMGLSITQLNSISLAAISAQYMSALFYGSIADYSARLSTFTSAVMFSIAYSTLAGLLSLPQAPSLPAFLACYALLGIGTVGSYFAAMTASAKSFPLHPGLAIGIPSALFGCGPIVLSFLGSTLFSDPDSGEIDAVKLFGFFAVLLTLVNLSSTWGLRPVVPDLKNIKEIDDGNDDDDRASVDSLPPTPTEEEPLLAASMILPPHSNLWHFLGMRYVWIFVCIVLLVNGPSEVISQNLGSITDSLMQVGETEWPDRTALRIRQKQIQIFSVVNTITRIVFGALSDYTCPTRYADATASTLPAKRRFTTPRLTYLQLSAVLLILASAYTAGFLDSVDQLWILSSLSGISYGLINVIGPALVSRVFGQQDLGRNFGVIWSIAATGPVGFGFLYGLVSDRSASKQHSRVCHGRVCFQFTFLSIAVGGVVALVLITVLKRRRTWRRC